MQQAIAHVSLVVRDYDEAIDFYVGTLGFRLLEDSPRPEQNKRWVVVAPAGSSGASLLLARASTPDQLASVGNQTAGRAFLFLQTDDFWRDYDRYVAAGVRFVRQPEEQPYGTVAVFEDVYGNLWDLLEYNGSVPYGLGAAQRSIQADTASQCGLTQVSATVDSSTPAELDFDAAGVSFRTAEARDLPELVRMLADDPLGAKREAWGDPLPVGYTEAFETIRQDPNNELVVAVVGEQLVGMLQITFIPYLTHQGRWRALIEGVRVASGARSKGLGAAMIRFAVQRAKNRDCVMVQLTTDRAREDALRFYERLGFVASHHGMKLHL